MTRSAAQIRQDFIRFFEERGHTYVPGASVVPHDDPTLLFTNAGMNQFKPLFLGAADRGSAFGRLKRAANSQPCIRAGGKHNDLDDVGHDTYHHTFFEMLGNWSFGDYFKKDAIAWAWELLTDVWKIDPERLHATYFGGDEAEGLAPDEEARELWSKIIAPARIHPGNKKDNFWEMGDTGPCGPCSELHIDLTPDKSGGALVNAGDARVMEIWNLVFIQFNRGPDGKLTPLPAKHVDTGMGLERVSAVLQGHYNNYATDVFTPILRALEGMTGHQYGASVAAPPMDNRYAAFAPSNMKDVACRVIADHIRTLTFAISDGAAPDSMGRGYVLRRILRRAVRYGWQYLGLREPFLCKLAPTVIDTMGEAFPNLRKNPAHVIDIIRDEEQSFARTLDRGIALFDEAARAAEPRERSDAPQPSPDRKGGVSRETLPRSAPENASAPSASTPAAYFITYHTYGTWLHGREEGSVDADHNVPGEPLVARNSAREHFEAEKLKQAPVVLNAQQRAAVETALTEVAQHRGWTLHACHVRTNHVHVVVSAPEPPERVLNDFKSYSTRKLREAGLLAPDVKPWALHGSTRYIWQQASIGPACAYVLEGQGGELPGLAEVSRAESDLSAAADTSSEGFLRETPPLRSGLGWAAFGQERGVISGADAFKLHDTYGFPIDLTQIMAQERGLTVDIAEYERLMEEARERAGRKMSSALTLPVRVTEFAEEHRNATRFDGYENLELETEVIGVLSDSGNGGADGIPEGPGWLVLRETPFYVEKGGQVGDVGVIRAEDLNWEFRVEEVIEVSGAVLHRGTVVRGPVPATIPAFASGSPGSSTLQGAPVRCIAIVDTARRIPTQKNHTATHILNWSLRETLGEHIQQKGSLVDPDKTRFDFSHPKSVSPQEIQRIEALCREQITRNLAVFAQEAPQADALKINGLRAVFGEKYPDRVRVVSIGAEVEELLKNPAANEWRAYSIEFCGGTHVKATGEIEDFLLTAEEAVAKGVRRVVGVTSDAARAARARGRALLKQASATLSAAEPSRDRKGAGAGEGAHLAQTSPAAPARSIAEVAADINKALAEETLGVLDRTALREILASLQQALKEQQKQASAASADETNARVDELLPGAERSGETTIFVAELPEVGVEQLKSAADRVKQKCKSAAVFFGVWVGREAGPDAEQKALLLAAVSDDLVKRGVKAGDWVKAIAPLVQGGGGGPPTMAQAGGKDPAKLGEALAAAKEWIRGKLV